MLYIWNHLNREHPFYYEPLNVLRSGTQLMVFHSIIVAIIGKAFEFHSVIIPILCMVGCFTGFFIGIFLCKKEYQKSITALFSRLKKKTLLYMKLENQYAQTSSTSSSKEESKSSSSSSSSNSNDEKESPSSNSDNNENESSVSSESESDNDSESNDNKLIKNEVFFSEETLNKINEKADLFNSIDDISNNIIKILYIQLFI